MKEYRLTDWLPTTKKEVELRGWDELDVILFSGDAYVDHPSFGAAVIGRILEAEGLRVAIIPQPNWRDDLRDFKKLGRPRLFFGISPGCMDSMVNKYTGCTSGYASGLPFNCLHSNSEEIISRRSRRIGRYRSKHAPRDAL